MIRPQCHCLQQQQSNKLTSLASLKLQQTDIDKPTKTRAILISKTTSQVRGGAGMRVEHEITSASGAAVPRFFCPGSTP